MTQQESNIIRVLRFPLILGVVLIHCRVIGSDDAFGKGLYLTSAVINLCTRFITSPCVPLFFFFSGYLFFCTKDGTNNFTSGDYFSKLRKRARTLLVPYIFWNIAVLALFAILHRFTPGLINAENHNVYNYSWMEFIRSFWNYPNDMPINYPFWFLRDLIIMILISPVVYLLNRYGKWVPAAILACLWVVGGGTNIFVFKTIPTQSAITFFIIGAAFSINRYDFSSFSRKLFKCTLPLWIISIISLLLVRDLSHTAVPNISCLLGMMVYLSAASYIKDNSVTRFLAASSFFVYAFHGIPIQFIINIMCALIHPMNDFFWIVTFMASFTATISLSLLLYWAVSSFFPKFTAIITGGR